MEKDIPGQEIRNRISRRDFARDAALAAAGIAAMPAAALASAAALPSELAEAGPQGDDKKLSPASQAEADAKLGVILNKYGSRLSNEQKTDLRRLVAEGQKPLEAIRAYSIENSNQPATVLKLYPESGTGPQVASPAPAAKKE